MISAPWYNTRGGHGYTPLPLPSPPQGEVAMELNDPGLFRQECYIGGAWVDAGRIATLLDDFNALA